MVMFMFCHVHVMDKISYAHLYYSYVKKQEWEFAGGTRERATDQDQGDRHRPDESKLDKVGRGSEMATTVLLHLPFHPSSSASRATSRAFASSEREAAS